MENVKSEKKQNQNEFGQTYHSFCFRLDTIDPKNISQLTSGQKMN